MGELGGVASHIALSPTAFAAEAARTTTADQPPYPNGLDRYQGLIQVSVPGLTPTTPIQPLVYAADDLMLVIARDWTAQASRDYAPAFKADKVALKLSGRFAVAAPVPGRSLRTTTGTTRTTTKGSSSS